MWLGGSGYGFGLGHFTCVSDTGWHPDRAEAGFSPFALWARADGPVAETLTGPLASSDVEAHGPVIFAHAHQLPLPWTCTCKSAVSWTAYLIHEK